MRERVGGLVRDRAGRRALTIGTFHALGLAILQGGAQRARLAARLRDLRPADQLGAVREAMRHVKDMGRTASAASTSRRS